MPGPKARVAFIHPDLGIGGAERLVIDAALALQSSGYAVTMYTSFHDEKRCFEETRDGRISVHVHGGWFPRHVFGACFALCAYVRMILCALALAFSGDKYDIIVCDQISACIPVLRTFTKAKILFYCHFPDQLLTQRESILKRVYRAPLDWLEQTTTNMAHKIYVNSNFTRGVFKNTFSRISKDPGVLYPSLNFSAFDSNAVNVDGLVPSRPSHVFLSINRYERKKNILLALQAYVRLRELLSAAHAASLWDGIHLVIAGGYDERLRENVEYFAELQQFVHSNGLFDHVTFIRSFTDEQKVGLLARSTCLLYTPSNEHFGITPLEAMYMHIPVIAVNSGGPLETIGAPTDARALNGSHTGLLCNPDPSDFAEAMRAILSDSARTKAMGVSARARVEAKFSFAAFTAQWDQACARLLAQ